MAMRRRAAKTSEILDRCEVHRRIIDQVSDVGHELQLVFNREATFPKSQDLQQIGLSEINRENSNHEDAETLQRGCEPSGGIGYPDKLNTSELSKARQRSWPR